MTEEEVKKGYERDGAPDPANYYIQSYSYARTIPYTRLYFPQLPIIESKDRKLLSITSSEKTRAEVLGADILFHFRHLSKLFVLKLIPKAPKPEQRETKRRDENTYCIRNDADTGKSIRDLQ